MSEKKAKSQSLLNAARSYEKKGDKARAASHYAQLGVKLLKDKQFEPSQTLLRKALSLSPQSARFYVALAICDFEMGDYFQANQSMAQFARLAIEQKKSQKYKEVVEVQLKRYPILEQNYYQGLLQIDKTQLQYFMWAFESHLKRKEFSQSRNILIDALVTGLDEAAVLQAFQRYVKESKDKETSRYLKRYSQNLLRREELISLLRGPKGEAEVAPTPPQEKSLTHLIEDLEKELGVRSDVEEVDPLLSEFVRRAEPILQDDAQALLDMAYAFYEMELYPAALDQLGKIGRSESLAPHGDYLKAQILYRQGSLLGALEVYLSLLRLDNLSPSLEKECLYHLVEFYIELGSPEQARFYLKTLERKDPDYRQIRALKKSIG